MKIKFAIALLGFVPILSGCATTNSGIDRNTAGLVIGGATGALIGSQFGSGSGAVVGAGIGAVGGALAGQYIANNMDK